MIEIYIHPLSKNGFIAHQKSIISIKNGDGITSSIETKRDWKEINALLNDLLDDKSFIDIFQHDDINLWQFYHAYIVADILYVFEIYKAFISIQNTYKNKSLIIFIPKDRYFDITQDLCFSIFDHVTISPIATESYTRTFLRKIKNYIFKDVNFYKIKKYIFNALIKVKKLKTQKNDQNRILFASHIAYSVVEKNFPFKENDRILDAYIKNVHKRGYSPIGIDCPYHLSIKNCFRMIKKILLPHDMIDWYGFFSFFFKKSLPNLYKY